MTAKVGLAVKITSGLSNATRNAQITKKKETAST